MKSCLKMRHLFTGLFCILFLNVYAAPRELLVNPEKPESWLGKVEPAPQYERGKGPCFVLYGGYPTVFRYKTLIPVDAAKTYTYKVTMRTLDPALPASGYLGFYLYDKNKRSIRYCEVLPLANSKSQVVSARKGDKFLMIKKFDNFERFKTFVVAFHAKDDFSDIPNSDVSPAISKVLDNGDGTLRIELKKPLTKEYPAGTVTRFHSPYTVPMYYLASGWMPVEGKECVAKMQGVSDKPGIPSVKFWKGTKYVQPMIWFGNWNRIPKKGAKLLVDGISFTVSE